jgi:hypothetical protein
MRSKFKSQQLKSSTAPQKQGVRAIPTIQQ